MGGHLRCDRSRRRRDGLGRVLRTGPARPARAGSGAIPARPRPRQFARPHADHPHRVRRTPRLRPARPAGVRAVVRTGTAHRPAPAHRMRVPERRAAGSEHVEGVRQSVREHNLAAEELSGDEINRRFPAFRFPAEYSGVLEQAAGFLYVEECVRAHLTPRCHSGRRFTPRSRCASGRRSATAWR